MVKLFKNLFRRSFVKNTFILIFGQTLASFINMLSSIFTVRAIGLTNFGMIMLGLTYIGIFKVLFSFQSFNAVIKFGHEAIAKNDKQLLKSYLKQAFLQDLFSAIFAFAISLFFLRNISTHFQWNNKILEIIIVLSFSTLFNISGSIIGLLRLYDKFESISRTLLFTSLVKLILVGVGLLQSYDYLYFVYIEMITLILSNGVNFFIGYITVKENQLQDFFYVNFKWDKNYVKFNIYNNLVITLDLPVGELTKMFIGQYLGIADLGLYSILTRIGSLINRLIDPITVVLFPELSRLVANGDSKKAVKISVYLTFFVLIFGGFFVVTQYLAFDFWSLFAFNTIIDKNIVLFFFVYMMLCASFNGIHQLFIAFNLVKYNILIVFIVNILYLIFTPQLMSNYGIFGLILALTLQAILVVIWKLAILYNRTHIK